MVHPVFIQHPRFTIASAIGLLTILLLISGQHSYGPSVLHGSKSVGLSVRERVEDAERDYAVVVSKRHAFIRKMGPDASRVVAFVEKVTLSQSID